MKEQKWLCIENAIRKFLVEPFMSDDAAATPPPALQQVHASAPAPASATVAHQTLKSEQPPTTTLEKPLAEKLTDDPPSPTDDVATAQ